MNTFPILLFHAIDDQPEPISFPRRMFHQCLQMLSDEGYQTVPLRVMAELLEKREPLPKRTVCMTFDDGFRSIYQHAFPLLQAYRMTATIFLITGRHSALHTPTRLPSFCGREMLNWQEIREMHQAGLEFGAHTLTHPDLAGIPYQRACAEILESRQIIEDALGNPVVSFAYPYGYSTPSLRDFVRQHFRCACSAKLGLVRPKSDPAALERVEMFYFRTEQRLRMMPTAWFPWYVRMRNLPRQMRAYLRRGRFL